MSVITLLGVGSIAFSLFVFRGIVDDVKTVYGDVFSAPLCISFLSGLGAASGVFMVLYGTNKITIN